MDFTGQIYNYFLFKCKFLYFKSNFSFLMANSSMRNPWILRELLMKIVADLWQLYV